jgi:phage portal protein BeeE
VASLIARWRSPEPQQEQRYSLEQYVADVTNAYYQGGLTASPINETYKGTTESIENDFAGVVAGAYKRNGVVFACQVSRLSVFAQARFVFKPIRPTSSSPGLFTTAALAPLQEPWINGSEGELLARMIQDVDNAGNAYIRRQPADSLSANRLERLRPDWVDIVLAGDPGMMTPTVIGYLYYPDGRSSGRRPEALTVDEVAHWSPYPDPVATYRGMAPLTPILREILADNAATMHKGEFFNHAATPNMAVKFDPSIDVAKFQAFKAAMESEHVGAANAWKTLYLGGGADVTPLGMSFRDMDYKAVQGLGETRIAAAFGVPAAIAQISEGLAGSSLNAGNFSAARRLFADKTMRWLWKDCCSALERIIDVPVMSRLWWDEREVAFLREDQKDAAEIQSTQAQTITALVREGFTPESVVPAVLNEDFSLLEHTGLLSVQLTPADPKDQPKDPANPDPADSDDDDNGDTGNG